MPYKTAAICIIATFSLQQTVQLIPITIHYLVRFKTMYKYPNVRIPQTAQGAAARTGSIEFRVGQQHEF